MTFWIITVALTLVIAGLFALALLRGLRDPQAGADYDLRVYRDQLAEVERDLARGVLSSADAQRVRTEVSRRILAADTAMSQENAKDGGAPKIMAAVVAVVLIVGSFGLYRGFGDTYGLGVPGYGDLALADRIEQAEERRATRPDQTQAEQSLPARPDREGLDENYVALVDKLRAAVAQRPDDVKGHLLLAQSESNLGNFAAAQRGLRVAIDLKGPDATVADLTDYADMMVLAAGGYVSPQAENVLRAILARDAANGPARYYMGLMMSQTGRPDVAFRVWDQLLRAGPADAPWIPPVLDQIADTAARAGINYQIPAIGTGTNLRGPTSGDIMAAGDMTGAERIEMIEGMVAGLSDRLATQGGPPEEWAQLIGALGVLERRGQAAAIYENAIEVFGDNPTAIDLITRAGQRAGVAE